MQSEDAPLTHKPAKDWAAGAPAVISSLKHVMSTAGPLRGTKALLDLNQHDGFDCPSCAWPDPDDHRAMSEFCENGAKAIASEATTEIVDPRFFQQYSVEELLEKSDYWHDQQGRLTHPMILRKGDTHYSPISWEDAFELLGEHLKELPTPDDAIFYTSGRTSNEAAFLYQLFVRHYGTQNLPDCSNMCHESSGSAMVPAIGLGKGSVTLEDLHQADTILCVGQNPGTNHPRMLAALERCVEAGGTIVGVNPFVEAGLKGFAHPQRVSGMLGKATELCTQYYQVKPNGDMALFRGIGKLLLELETQTPGTILDHTFLKEHTAGLEEYKSACAETPWPRITEESGISKEKIETLTHALIDKRKRVITCWAMGITQQHNGVATIREITNVHLLLGAIGREGAGLCPVRGHSNVQGDRTMGIYEKAPEAFHLGLESAFEFHSPRKHGYDTVETIQIMHQQAGKFFLALGGNFLQAAPDTTYVTEALKNCSLTCHIATKLNRSHLITGDIGLILPCLGRTEKDLQESGEQFITCENSMGIVHMSRGRLKPASPDLLSEPMIVARLATAAIGNTPKINWLELVSNYDHIRTAIESSIAGFEDFNQKVRQAGGFYLDNGPRDRRWNTPNGKANFLGSELETFTVPADRLILQTFRSHDQYNTTIYGLDDRYRGIGNERLIVFLNAKDMQERGIKPTQETEITSHWKGEQRVLRGLKAIPYDIPRGSAAAYFPEANILVPVTSTAKLSNTPTSKSIEVSILPIP